LISLFALLQSVPFVVPQNNIVQKIGCGFGCHYEIKQLTPMVQMDNGWRKVKVKYMTYFWNYEKKEYEQRGFSNSLGNGVWQTWNYSNCKKELFTQRSKEFFSALPEPNKNIGERNQIVFNKGKPIFSSAAGSPFQKWQAMCPKTKSAKEGNQYIKKLWDSLIDSSKDWSEEIKK
tara:strand:- start:217 stop:741 length:525 start_codon:yes stop_codon:yes gene_type:complete